MTATVKVLRTSLVFGGWKGSLDIRGGVLHITGVDPSQRLNVDTTEVKRYSYNGNNGLWVIRMKDGTKLRLQTSGAMMSADRSAAGKAATEAIHDLLSKTYARGFSI